jgi:16S rRNA (uracil1498-N3)-methyltransferase
MTAAEFLVNPGEISKDTKSFTLDGDEGRHAATVKRMREGEVIHLCDGQGSRAVATVVKVHKHSLDLTIDNFTFEEAPEPRFVVVQALAKGERAELAVEMLTEVGADAIIPWRAEHSIGKWDSVDKGLEKWRRTSRESAKQSRRAWIPEISNLQTTAQVCELMSQAQSVFVLHESADQALAACAIREQGTIMIVVGPEGGISPDELAAFSAAGARVVHMGASVMRTSTAGAIAVGGLLMRSQRWS